MIQCLPHLWSPDPHTPLSTCDHHRPMAPSHLTCWKWVFWFIPPKNHPPGVSSFNKWHHYQPAVQVKKDRIGYWCFHKRLQEFPSKLYLSASKQTVFKSFHFPSSPLASPYFKSLLCKESLLPLCHSNIVPKTLFSLSQILSYFI